MIENVEVPEHKRIVEEAGGDYVKSKVFGYLVMFNSRQTGSTLCVKENKLSVEAVRERIAASNHAFGIF